MSAENVKVCHSFVGPGDRCMHRTTYVQGTVRTTLYCWRVASQHWDYPRGEWFE